MKKKTKWLTALLAVPILAGGVIVAQRRGAAPAPAEEKPAEAAIELSAEDIATAEAGEIQRLLPVTGALRAVSQAVVKAKVAGEVTEVLAKEGDPVKSGQLLARIDEADYRARFNERAAALEASRAQARFAEQSRRKYQELLAKQFISETAYDNYRTNADVAEGGRRLRPPSSCWRARRSTTRRYARPSPAACPNARCSVATRRRWIRACSP
ncbi:hypothetical protein MASR1M97_33180 [Candidatus Desulfobacillus denitrificans]